MTTLTGAPTLSSAPLYQNDLHSHLIHGTVQRGRNQANRQAKQNFYWERLEYTDTFSYVCPVTGRKSVLRLLQLIYGLRLIGALKSTCFRYAGKALQIRAEKNCLFTENGHRFLEPPIVPGNLEDLNAQGLAIHFLKELPLREPKSGSLYSTFLCRIDLELSTHKYYKSLPLWFSGKNIWYLDPTTTPFPSIPIQLPFPGPSTIRFTPATGSPQYFVMIRVLQNSITPSDPVKTSDTTPAATSGNNIPTTQSTSNPPSQTSSASSNSSSASSSNTPPSPISTPSQPTAALSTPFLPQCQNRPKKKPQQPMGPMKLSEFKIIT